MKRWSRVVVVSYRHCKVSGKWTGKPRVGRTCYSERDLLCCDATMENVPSMLSVKFQALESELNGSLQVPRAVTPNENGLG